MYCDSLSASVQEISGRGKKLADWIAFRVATGYQLCDCEVIPETGLHIGISGQPCNFYYDAIQNGFDGIPELSELNKRIFDYYSILHTNYTKQNPKAFDRLYSLINIFVGSTDEEIYIWRAWSRLYSYHESLNKQKGACPFGN